jgi:SAM-dependent methyltransferase
MRIAEARAVDGLTLDGKILDVGGDPKSKYHQLIGGDHQITFANISEDYRPDIIFDAQEPWPVGPGSYDAVLMFNFLEHVFEHRTVLAEAFKALAPGGRLIGTVPFMFNVHGSPSDYFRYTEFALRKLFDLSGFEVLQLKTMGTGAFCVAWATIQGPLPEPIAVIGRTLATGLDRLCARIKPGNKMGPETNPIGYFFDVRRPPSP